MNENISVKPKLNYNLEALRGFAALFVVLHHTSYHHKTFNANVFPKIVSAFEPNGHLCVLIFFMLSGYVIAISNKKTLERGQILNYVKKRFLRIYPIYFVAMLFTILVTSTHYSFFTIVGNFTLLQGSIVEVISENNPVWSLNYEVLYYLLFIPISYFNIKPINALITSILIGVVNALMYTHLHTPIISSYLWGFSFWITGLCIAKYFKRTEVLSYQKMLSNVFLLLSMSYYQFPVRILYHFSKFIQFPRNTYWAEVMISFFDFAYLPYCFIFISNYIGIKFLSKKPISIFFQILPVLSLFSYIITPKPDDLLKLIITSFYYLVSTILFFVTSNKFENFSKKIIAFSIPLGRISYGLYIIHFPILVIFGRIRFFENSFSTYILEILCFLLITFLLSYLLEKKFQPLVKKVFQKPTIPTNII